VRRVTSRPSLVPRLAPRWSALLALAALNCGGGDSSLSDASSDATVDAPDQDASADVWVDTGPEQAIWAASATTLYRFDPIARIVTRVADFDCNGEAMLDLAMNGAEELYGVTAESLMRIDKTTGACTVVAKGQFPYGIAFLPATATDAGVEQLVGYKYSVYDRVDPDSGAVSFAGDLTSDAGTFTVSGDLVSIPGGPTYVTAFGYNPSNGDAVLEIDPATGAAVRMLGYTKHDALLGLAQWAGVAYAFPATGGVFSLSIDDAGVTLKPVSVTYDLGDAGLDASVSDAGADAGDAATDAAPAPPTVAWRGAAVTTRAPSQ
jgi:hypothetical protein